MKLPVILCDDPDANDVFDLRGILSRGGPCRLALVVEPEKEAGSASAGAPEGATEARYRLTSAVANGVPPRTFTLGEAPAALLELAGSPPILVTFVSRATAPLVEALAADERTARLLRVGVTGVRLDDNYNLAQKLLGERKLHYHEHSRALEKLLQPRLATMLRARVEVQSGGSVQA